MDRKHLLLVALFAACAAGAAAPARALTTYTEASSYTGGTVSAGREATSTSEAAVDIQTTVGGEGGSAVVHIETESGGQKHEETYTKVLPPKGVAAFIVSSSTNTHSTGSASSPQASSGQAAASTTLPAHSLGGRIVSSVAHLLARFFAWFR